MNVRSVYLWLNIAFGVVLLGLLLGASSQPWYLIVALAWMVTGFVLIERGRRNAPKPPSLFDDRDRRDPPDGRDENDGRAENDRSL
ncbi:MAG: hypothetical protein QOI70_441 [Microbacteriaceae bacterium]|nr:hypothetical protein [Microbacteriaceae bacterium]